MLTFALLAALLIAAVIVLLVPPLLRGRAPTASADRRQANLAIFRDQLAELERERQDGTLAEADYTQSRDELQRRLLEDVSVDATPGAVATPAKKTAVALALVLPVAALVGYSLLGNPRALDPTQTKAQTQVTPDQIVGMVDKLAARLKDNPDDKQGWIMLGRSYKMLNRFPEAAEAYGKAGDAVQDNSALLADYAETLALANGGKFTGKPTELLNRALKLNDKEPQALILAGVAAGDRGDFKAAEAYWSRLLPMVEPGSEEEQSIKAGIAKLKERAAGKAGSQAPAK